MELSVPSYVLLSFLGCLLTVCPNYKTLTGLRLLLKLTTTQIMWRTSFSHSEEDRGNEVGEKEDRRGKTLTT